MNRTLNFYEHRKPGKLITFCGLDGCGKSTMLYKLWNYLHSKGYDISLTKQPTDFVRKSAIFRTYMDSPVHDHYDYRSLSLLAASDRVQHTNRVIIPDLEDGKIVLSDRYFYSCLANLRARGYESDEWIYEVATFLAKPDLAIFLDVSVDTAVERVRKRSDEKERYIDMDLQYKLREQYQIIAKENQCLLISSEMSEEETWTAIQNAVDNLFTRSTPKSSAQQIALNLLHELAPDIAFDSESSLDNDLGLDSLERVTLLVTLEDKLGSELAPQDMDLFSLQTVGDVIALAKRYEMSDPDE